MSVARNTCRELAPVLQQAIDWVVELNFGPGEIVPKLTFDLDDHASWAEVCLAIDHGVPVSRSAFYDRYGMPEPADEDDSFTKPADPKDMERAATAAPQQGAEAALVSNDVQGTALNGAQVAALLEIASQVAQKQLPVASAMAIAQASFPLVKPEVIGAIFNPLGDISLADQSKKKVQTRLQQIRRSPLTLS
jgi:hypothetical protein